MIHLPEDREICEELLRSAWERGDRAKPLAEIVVETGQRFLGAPYEPATLEREGPEELVVNLRAFDCVTFVENAIVLAGLIRAGKTGFADYLAALERIRYRRGRLDGYASRLHYFTDWLYDNGRKGIVRDVTRAIGGVPFRKAFHYLTDRREDHPALKDPATFRRLRLIEGTCSRRSAFLHPESRSHRDREPDRRRRYHRDHDGRKGDRRESCGARRPPRGGDPPPACIERGGKGRSVGSPAQELPHGAAIPDGHHRRPGDHAERGLTHTGETPRCAPPPGGKREKKGKTDDRPGTERPRSTAGRLHPIRSSPWPSAR